MQLTFLGTGAAFTVADGNFQSNMFVEASPIPDDPVNRRGLLLDCGSDIRWSMKAQGLDHTNVDALYISHLHADHVGGLEWLAFRRYFDPDCAPPDLFIHESLVDELWTHCLQAGLEGLKFGKADLETYFTLHSLPSGGTFQWQGLACRLVRLPHFICGDQQSHSYGLMMAINNRRTLLTTDSMFHPETLAPFYEEADVILQDCETLVNCESGAHAHYHRLLTLPEVWRERMWLYHYNDGGLPGADGFKGFAQPGQVISLA
ncbi:MBL fold metallo-hydrolase [Magnetospira sp. QH-2]|uniref:MBL fold metallo-hydrolase n=1 Tax=Magnetospira sp. (strain QH-2) TaxID=1288970 RepID=UPI0003E81512|nr:MBL fold metallo-hydrolase [Magnetospira sp. QH-2]CCQ74914.1 putative Metallo-beta-lactamase superfamily protein [Magnetospira sp. QH-2]